MEKLSDFLPVQDWFNEMHAKNASKKVRAVFQNKGMSGKPFTTAFPYGYKKIFFRGYFNANRSLSKVFLGKQKLLFNFNFFRLGTAGVGLSLVSFVCLYGKGIGVFRFQLCFCILHAFEIF